MRRLVALVTAVAGLLLLGAGAAEANPPDEDRFVAALNEARSTAGIGGLRVAPDLVVIARRHATRMAAEDRLYHNPQLGSEVQGWEVVAENVGRGSSVDHVHQMFMASASHRENIQDRRVTEVGVGVVWKGSVLYVAQVFRKPTGSQAAEPAAKPVLAPSPAPERPPAPAAAPTPAPTTTVAPVSVPSWPVSTSPSSAAPPGAAPPEAGEAEVVVARAAFALAPGIGGALAPPTSGAPPVAVVAAAVALVVVASAHASLLRRHGPRWSVRRSSGSAG